MKKLIEIIHLIFEKSESEKLKEKVLNEEIDFKNVISSSLLAKQLYDELKIISHPDRFQDPEQITKATELFQNIHQNKGDYNKLLILKDQVYTELLNNGL